MVHKIDPTCEFFSISEHPVLNFETWRKSVQSEVQKGARVVNYFAHSSFLFLLLAYDHEQKIALLKTEVEKSFPSLTPEIAQVHLFERSIFEESAILPEGHPWLKPVRFKKEPIGLIDFYKIEGEEIHEVGVGPVHAGIIEPGHFRFQCYGETVLHLEISLGYQHRGVERALLENPFKRRIHYMETLSGDTTIGHTTAYCQLLENISSTKISKRAAYIRAVALELERLANHTGDLGALANDIGYLPTSSFCGRLRGSMLNITAMLCGNRFGRSLVAPGGVLFDIDETLLIDLKKQLDAAYDDILNATELLFKSPSVLNRFETTGTVSKKTASDIGLVGLAARASHLHQDIRQNFPSGTYKDHKCPMAILTTGDVYARAQMRYLEIKNSYAYIQTLLKELPKGLLETKLHALPPNCLGVSLVEGWRGEICHTLITGPSGDFLHYKVVDPSFHNWTGLSFALRNEQISDFPLINKSFNLSYCGHDL